MELKEQQVFISHIMAPLPLNLDVSAHHAVAFKELYVLWQEEHSQLLCVLLYL